MFPNQTRYRTCGLACPVNSDHVYKYLRYAYVHVHISQCDGTAEQNCLQPQHKLIYNTLDSHW